MLHPSSSKHLTPYAVGIVELENGLKIPGMIQGITQEQLKIGMELTLDFGTCSTPQQWPSGKDTASNPNLKNLFYYKIVRFPAERLRK